MKISILQTDIIWANPEENAIHAAKLMEKAEKSDIYVLPEMWSTGFATSPEGIAETENQSLLWMQDMAERLDAAISGTVSIYAKGYRNRHYFVYPDRTYQYYDKRHLFSYGGENKNYTAGDRRVVVEWKGYRILLLTCYDLRFPVWSRNNNDYDAIIIAANWPDSRQRVWETLLTARAMENQCYVIAANRTGKDPQCNYIGGSFIIDAKGKNIAANTTDGEEIITAVISRESLDNFRNKFQVLNDKDNFNIIM
ncbi:MAG: amidohydrolase [Prevotella sp.]|nr:amidohydrolase [Prevotella sp.]